MYHPDDRVRQAAAVLIVLVPTPSLTVGAVFDLRRMIFFRALEFRRRSDKADFIFLAHFFHHRSIVDRRQIISDRLRAFNSFMVCRFIQQKLYSNFKNRLHR